MSEAQEPQRVPAAEFIRSFANWRIKAARRPVMVTHHGKDAHVLVSLDDYRRLDGSAIEGPKQASSFDARAEIFDSIRDAVILIDHAWRIVAANVAAGDLAEQAVASLVGRPLIEAFPTLKASVLYPHLVRLIDFRERFSGDVPGVLRPRHWHRIDLVPLRHGGALIMRDISAEMAMREADDARRATMVALDASGAVGYARLSVRETVEAANDRLVEWVGTDPVAVRRVRFSALLAADRRAAFVDALETLFRSGDPQCLGSELVIREGLRVPVTLSMAEVRGVYACEGAIILILPDPRR